MTGKIVFHWRDMPMAALEAWNEWYESDERKNNAADSSIRADHAAFNAGWFLAREGHRPNQCVSVEDANRVLADERDKAPLPPSESDAEALSDPTEYEEMAEGIEPP